MITVRFIMRVARLYVISGRVQGVGFRWFTEAAAVREGLQGWVSNRSDGRVEIAVEGDAEAVERFDRHIRHGPTGAHVDDVQVNEETPSGRDSGFSIK